MIADVVLGVALAASVGVNARQAMVAKKVRRTTAAAMNRSTVFDGTTGHTLTVRNGTVTERTTPA